MWRRNFAKIPENVDNYQEKLTVQSVNLSVSTKWDYETDKLTVDPEAFDFFLD